MTLVHVPIISDKEEIKSISKLDGRLLVIGDFSYPGINWSDWTTQHGELHEEFLFIESLRDNFLIQHISESTRYRECNEPSTIDLLIPNEESDIISITILLWIGLSDHCLLLFEYFCCQKESHSDESQTFMKYFFVMNQKFKDRGFLTMSENR